MRVFDRVVMPNRLTRLLHAIMVGDHVLPLRLERDLWTALPTVAHRRDMRGVLRALYNADNDGDLALLTAAAGATPLAALLPLLGYTLRDGRFVAHGISMPGCWPTTLPPAEDTPETWAGLRVHCHARLICPPSADRRARA